MKLNILGKLIIILTSTLLSNCYKLKDQTEFESQLTTLKTSITDKIFHNNLVSKPNQNLLKNYFTKNLINFSKFVFNFRKFNCRKT